MRIISILLLTTFFLCGCSSRYRHINSMAQKLTVPEKTFLTITNDSSLDTVKNALGRSARHEFTIVETNEAYTLISCLVPDADGYNFWLLFRDKILLKIIRPVSPEMETYPYEGTTASRIKSWDVEDIGRIRKVIDAPALTRDQIKNMLNDLSPDTNTTSRSWNVFPAFLLTGYFWKAVPQIEKDYEINEELSKRYDGCWVNLGMNAEDVEKHYGKPLRVFAAKNGETARVYGDTRHLEFINSLLAFTGMAVVIDAEGRVKAIYSHEFFNEEWKK